MRSSNLHKTETMKGKLPKQFIIAFFMFACIPVALSTDTLYGGQNITDGQYLISSNGIFELGFFSPNSSTDRFLGIWFKVSTDAVVWVSNRDNPLKTTSGILSIHNNGSLALYDSSERMVWSSSSNTTSIQNGFRPVLQLNDSGNLILKDQTSNSIIWQSFDHPTDTLLAGMKLGKNFKTGSETVLSSWKNSNDPSKGNYICKMDTEGAPEVLIRDKDQIWYRTGMWNGKSFSGITQMTSYGDIFTLSFVWDNDEVWCGFETNSNSTLSRVVMNDAGILQQFFWDPNQQTWNVFWSVPQDECDSYAKCGSFCICQPKIVTSCNCLRGFEGPTAWSMSGYTEGCKRRTPLQCTAKSNGFYELNGVKLPDSKNATVNVNISIEDCQARCLMNCSCLAYSPSDSRGKGSGCVMWNTALVDMKYIDRGPDVLYVKVSLSELVSTEKSLAQNDSLKDADLLVFDMDTLLQATDNFSISNVVGQGGFGTVYKGKLPYGQEIAVKRLSGNSSQGLNEFMNEATLIAKLQHRNLVRLLGYSIQDNERMLIYEFLTNKSLDFFIFDAKKRAILSWRTRLEIVTGIARGLLYLHHDSSFGVLLLEIISGKRNHANQELVTNAWNLWEEQSILKLVDEAVEDTVFATELLRFVHVGLLCVQEFPDDRPSMPSVFMMLSSDNLVLPAPKKPSTWRNIGESTADRPFFESGLISVDHMTITCIEGR
ncbi:G-type lectin S-receptor-like serine/threonine-protein kinase [Rhynchospora pubera]|uniref:Receptor-like serine/threonine-protein kinase n=1 Tax=Rhynchospora pubera TaxID=906938 RepID=A0AAV8C1D9_9POAL|nr:G-type lectin S-receptor-like serine/threonine-protein kinase [Rhynchospora pubera]